MKALPRMLLLVALCACGRPGPSTDSKSNWLNACTRDRECADGLSCICGVCTMACAGATGCDRDAADAACVAAAEAALPPACVAELDGVAPSVCLAACSTNAQCGEAQVCVKGSCISAAAAGVQSAGSDASSPASGLDASPSGPLDGGLWPPLPDAAAGPGEAGGSSNATNDAAIVLCDDRLSCVDGRVCHVDGTCVVTGVADRSGFATLAEPVPASTALWAANHDFVFGTDNESMGPSPLLRWPVSGGTGQSMVDDRFHFGPSSRVLVDDDFVYLNAVDDPIVGSTATLYRVPIDEPGGQVESFGKVGLQFVQDDRFLYFTDPDSASVIRTPKDMPEARETVYVRKSAPALITKLALNGNALFVLELQSLVPRRFEVHAIDRATLTPRTVERSGAGAAAPSYLFATDSYLIVADGETLERTDLATGETSSWRLSFQDMKQLGDTFYLTKGEPPEDPTLIQVQRLDIESGVLEEPLVIGGDVKSMVPAPTALFILAELAGVKWSIVRIDR